MPKRLRAAERTSFPDLYSEITLYEEGNDMAAFKRFAYIILIIAGIGGIFLVYNIHESRPANVHSPAGPALEREFMTARQVDEGDTPRVWILGDPEDEHYGEIYSNVRQLCQDLQLTVAGEGRLDMKKAETHDMAIFCDATVSHWADQKELESFIAGGGRAILAAGFAEGDEDSDLWSIFGIQEISPGDDFHYLAFEKPLLPLQPEAACYDGNSSSARMKVSEGAEIYIRALGEEDIPILYTYDWLKGRVCVINGSFLADVRCAGLLTGAMTALLPDFIYPVLGVKAVFLDNLPMITPEDEELCRKVYGYSAEGFVRDVMWPAFQGTSLRTNTPYTSSILAAASSEEYFETWNDAVLTVICKSALKFGGELTYAVNCREDEKIVFNRDFIQRFSEIFTGYTVRGLTLETDNFSPEMLDIPGAEIRSVRGMLDSRDTRLSWEDGCVVFPVVTEGNTMDDGNLFAIYSILGAYGMVSHVFDVHALITKEEEPAAWDKDKLQVGYFESEILSRAPWLEGRTLSQTEDDVRSYQEMDYGWTRDGSRVELDCGGAVKGQAFFYHTSSRIAAAKGLTYLDLGEGYYLLRMQENHGTLTLEEG